MDDKLKPNDAADATPVEPTDATEPTEKPASRVKSLVRQGVRVKSGIRGGGPKRPPGFGE